MRQLLLLCLILTSIQLNSQTESTYTAEERVYGLSQLWRGATMNFAFFEQVPELSWDTLYLEMIPKVEAATSDYEYVRLLQNMCSQLEDGHTRVFLPRHLQQKRGRPAITTQLIEGRVYITGVVNDTIAGMGIKKGMEILKIDGKEVHQYAKEEVAPYNFASTQQDKAIRVYKYDLLRGWKNQPVRLLLKDQQGQQKEVVLPRNLKRHIPPQPGMTFEVRENGIGHLSINRFWGEDFYPTFDSIYPMVQQTKALILDIRENNGGNSEFSAYVLQHLSNKPFYMSNWSTPVYNAAAASWGLEQEWYVEKGTLVEPTEEITPYGKPVVVLIGPETYSAAEDFCSYYQQSEIGPMIGSPSAGSTGNPIGVQLLHNLWSQICTKKDVFYDGTEFVGFGVTPDITAKQSAADFWEEKDTVLGFAQEHLADQLKK